MCVFPLLIHSLASKSIISSVKTLTTDMLSFSFQCSFDTQPIILYLNLKYDAIK